MMKLIRAQDKKKGVALPCLCSFFWVLPKMPYENVIKSFIWMILVMYIWFNWWDTMS